jgi:N utilization substance protein B
VPSGRRSARRQAVFVLYQQDLLGLTLEAAIERAGDDKVDPYARRLLIGVSEQRQNIDEVLGEHITGWSLERLGMLERAILRSAVYELLWEPEVPEAVAIDEAVVLAKRFCSVEAGALVNGVLGAVAGSGVRTDPDASHLSED